MGDEGHYHTDVNATRTTGGTSLQTTRRRDRSLVLGVVAAITILHLLTLRDGHDWGGDFSLYLQHAENIAGGRPYVSSRYIHDSHLAGNVPPAAYPPVFPLLLAPAFAVWANPPLTVLKAVVVVLFSLALLTVYSTLRTRLSAGQALLATAAVGLNPFLWQFKDSILSDLPFLLFAYLTLWLATRLLEGSSSERDSPLLAVTTGLTLYLAIGTRTVGIALMPTLLAYESITRRRFPKTTALTASVAVALVAVQSWLLGATSSYGGMWRLELSALLHNLYSYPAASWHLFDNGQSQTVAVVLAALLGIVAMAGFVIVMKKQFSILEMFAVFYAIPLLLWPHYQGMRFLIPLVPLLFYWAIVAATELRRRRPLTQYRIAVTILLLAVGISYVSHYATANYGRIKPGITDTAAEGLFGWVHSHTTADDLLIFAKPRVLAYFTQTKAADYYTPERQEDIWDYFDRIGATYVIAGPTDKYLHDLSNDFADRLFLAHENRSFKVYCIRRENTESRCHTPVSE